MAGMFKLAALSAVLSAGVVAALNVPATSATPPGKLYVDRLPAVAESEMPARVAAPARPKANATENRPACGGSWPYIQPICIAQAEGAPQKRVRVIAIENQPERVAALPVAKR